MAGFDNEVVYGSNVDFSGSTTVTGQVTTNGQLLIGSTVSPNIRVGNITSTGGTLTITNGAGTINLEVAGGAVAVEHLTGDTGGQLNPVSNNFNLLGQQAGTIAVMDTIGSGATIRFEDRSWITQYVVDPSSTAGLRGTFTTIQAAITAASAGQTIFIRTGTYTENLTLKNGVNLSSFGSVGSQNGYVPGNTIIIGKHTASSNVASSFFGIQLQTNSDYVLTVGATSTVTLYGCCVSATNSTPFNITSSTGNIFLVNSTCDLGTTGIALVSMTNGNLWLYNTNATNIGLSTTATTCSAGNINIFNSSCACVLATTSTGQVMAYRSTLDTSVTNTTTITTAGTGTTLLEHCIINSGSASAISVGSGTTVNAYGCIVSSSNTNAITGAGTLSYSALTFSGTSTVINPTTNTGVYTNLGKWKASSQPVFLAYQSANATNATGDGTAYTVIFDVETTDIGSNYNNSTGTFTAPVTGNYKFALTINFANFGVAHTNIQTRVVTTAATFLLAQVSGAAENANGLAIAGSVICPMTAGDTATFQAIAANSTKTVTISGGASPRLTFVSGMLVS